jgi:sigma-B regulation protein RsbU (phosphoserine phosphatase)
VATAPAVGILEDWRATASTLALGPGDLLLLFSDGVTEAGRTDDNEFGETRLIETLRTRRSRPLTELLPSLVSAVEAHAGLAHEDDLTLVALRGV